MIVATLLVRRWLYRTQLHEHRPARGHAPARQASP
jgi:hypothetical protein